MAYRSHPANITADRLIKHRTQAADKLTAQEQEAVDIVIVLLRQIAAGHR